MSLVIIILGLGALIAWTLYATGIFESGALFFAVGALPGSDVEVDPTLMLGLHAVMLVLVGYIFGFMHGSLHRAVQHHLRLKRAQVHDEPAVTEAPVIQKTQKLKPRLMNAKLKQWFFAIGTHARRHTSHAQRSGREAVNKGRTRIRQLMARALIVVAALAIWAQPRLLAAAKRVMRLMAHGAKKAVEIIEKIWVWFRYP